MTANLIRHLLRKHPEKHKEFEAADKGTKQKGVKRTLAQVQKFPDPKQHKISDYTGTEVVLKYCVDLAVHHAIPFQTFNHPPMQALIKFAKLGGGDKSPKVVNAENVKIALSKQATQKRVEIRKLLKGKLVNLMADFATCERRSFFGRFFENLYKNLDQL